MVETQLAFRKKGIQATKHPLCVRIIFRQEFQVPSKGVFRNLSPPVLILEACERNQGQRFLAELFCVLLRNQTHECTSSDRMPCCCKRPRVPRQS